MTRIIDEIPDSEIHATSRFEEALFRLSAIPEKVVPLQPSNIDILEIRKSLESVGYNLSLTEAEVSSLHKTQFRNFNTGRGIGVAAIVGQEKSESIKQIISQLAEGRAKIGSRQGSEGRGLYQFLADTFELVTTPHPTSEQIKEYCDKQNQRVLKGLRKAHEYKKDSQTQEIISLAFAGVEDRTNVKKFASIPPHTLPELWAHIA